MKNLLWNIRNYIEIQYCKVWILIWCPISRISIFIISNIKVIKLIKGDYIVSHLSIASLEYPFNIRQTIFSHLSFYAKLKVCAKGGLQFLCKSKPIITIHHATKKYSNIFLIIFNGRLKNVSLQNIDGIFNKKYLQNFFH